jgi:lactoylglutathione lyase
VAPAVQANLVFLYYRDLAAAQRFYEDVIGLTLCVDQGFCKIYRVTPTSFVGLVDEARGMHRASDPKPVTLSFITDDLDAWYARLIERGVAMHHPLARSGRHPTRNFVAIDPEGYFLEFETFLDDPENACLRAALNEVYGR